MIFLTVPIFVPVIESLGFDLIWFGIVPFFCADLCRLSIVVAFPSVALWLPKLVYGPF